MRIDNINYIPEAPALVNGTFARKQKTDSIPHFNIPYK